LPTAALQPANESAHSEARPAESPPAAAMATPEALANAPAWRRCFQQAATQGTTRQREPALLLTIPTRPAMALARPPRHNLHHQHSQLPNKPSQPMCLDTQSRPSPPPAGGAARPRRQSDAAPRLLASYPMRGPAPPQAQPQSHAA